VPYFDITIERAVDFRQPTYLKTRTTTDMLKKFFEGRIILKGQ
jgi:hypothetical protein